MTDLPEQLPDARAVLVAAYQMSLAADMAHVEWQQTGDESPFVNAQHGREQAQALAAIGAGLATIEAAELTRVDFIEMADQGRRLAAVERQIPADLGHPRGTAAGETVGLMAAARVVEAWRKMQREDRTSVGEFHPALGNALDGAADLLGMTDADRAAEQVRAARAGDRVEDGGMMGTLIRCPQCGGDGLLHKPDRLPETAAPQPEQAQPQPLPPVDNVAGCDATDLGRRCVRLADHEDGHLFPPLVPLTEVTN